MNVNKRGFNYDNKNSDHIESAALAMLSRDPDLNARDLIHTLANISGNYNMVSNSFDVNMMVDILDRKVIEMKKEK